MEISELAEGKRILDSKLKEAIREFENKYPATVIGVTCAWIDRLDCPLTDASLAIPYSEIKVAL